jgi:protein YIPF5/7
MWHENNEQYGQSQYYSNHAGSSSQLQSQQPPLQFYGSDSGYYPASRTSLDGNMDASSNSGFGGSIQSQSWWSAFGTGGIDGEPPLLEGISHLLRKYILPTFSLNHRTGYQL